MSTLHDFAQRRQRGAEVLDALADAVDALDATTDDGVRQLRALAGRAREGRFHVLLLGCFSSGKSTLLNALIGAPVLPVKVNPCTAILTELVFAEAPGVEVRYRDGRPARQLGIDAFLSEFQLATSEHEAAGAEASDRFGDVERAVVAWPLPLLADGVVLVDTPGLDDDAARTGRTLASLPEADAVIVVLNATRFLTDLERRTLRRDLLPLGLTNLFFPVTMVDLLDALSDDPARDLAELTRRGREFLGPLCQADGEDRFSQRFFPLDARGGLLARYDRAAHARREPADLQALDRSGLPPFEEALAHFLVHERGRAWLTHLADVARRVRDDLARQATLDQATASATVDELRARQEALAPRFAQLSTIARRVGRTVDGFIERQQVRVWQDLRDFLGRAETELPEAAAGFDLGNLASLDLLRPGGRAKVEAALRDELELWLSQQLSRWQKEQRAAIERSLRDLRDELAAETRDFDELVGRIVGDFSGGTVRLPELGAGSEEVNPLERWFSVALGAALLSPGAMAAGWTQGYEGALKGAASRLGIRVTLLAIGALLGPIGWAGLLLYVIADAVLLAFTGGGQLRRVREQVAENLRGKLVAQADATRADIAAQVAAGLQPLRDAVVQAAEAEAAEVEALLARTIADREKAASDAAGRGAAWERALSRLQIGLTELEGLVQG